MYKIFFDILLSSILYASVLSFFVPLFKSYYAKYPVFSSIILYVLFVIICGTSIFFPIALHQYISYTWILQILLIVYGGYIVLRLLFLVLSWRQLLSEKIYLPKRLKYVDQYKNTIAKDIYIRKKIILHINQKEGSPFTWGWLNPIISFPQLAIEKLSHLQIKSLLLHELVHIKQKDYVIGIVLYIIHSIFVFNPFVRWWIREIRFLQEVVCDKRVIKRYSIKEYIEALLLFTKNNTQFSFLKISVNYDLYNRIALMLGESKLKFNKKIRYSSLVSCALLFFLAHYHNISNSLDITKYNHTTIQKSKSNTQSIGMAKVIIATKKTSVKKNISHPIKTGKIKSINTPHTLIAKANEPIATQKEDIDLSQTSTIDEQNLYNKNVHNIKSKKYLIPENMNKDSLITSMVSKATFMLIQSKEIEQQYPHISKILTPQQIKNIQHNSKSRESIQLLNYFMNLMYKRLQLHIEDIDWQVLNMRLDNQVVDIILTQRECQ